ncbi:unnamed protein product, partial [Trypanosoma congolense IL3000]
MQKLRRLMCRLWVHMLAIIRYLAWCNIQTLQEQVEWQENTRIEAITQFILQHAIQNAALAPTSPFLSSFFLPFVSGADAESDDDLDTRTSSEINRLGRFQNRLAPAQAGTVGIGGGRPGSDRCF